MSALKSGPVQLLTAAQFRIFHFVQDDARKRLKGMERLRANGDLPIITALYVCWVLGFDMMMKMGDSHGGIQDSLRLRMAYQEYDKIVGEMVGYWIVQVGRLRDAEQEA